MRVVPKSLVRLGLPAVAALGLVLAGCGEPAAPSPSAPPSSSSPASPLPSGTLAPTAVPSTGGTSGSDGLTVRYLADDGSVKTVRVEDFPR
jgi:hypothetical protein